MLFTIKSTSGWNLFTASPASSMKEAVEAAGKFINLSGANLEGSDLEGVNLEDANLTGANLKGANLKGANLNGARLIDANLKGANLNGAKLIDANLQGANLTDATLIRADLSLTSLGWASLHGANLEGATLNKANLYRANFEKSDLAGAELTGAFIPKDVDPKASSSADTRRAAILSLLAEDEQLRQRLNIKPGLEFSSEFDLERLLKVAVSRRSAEDPCLQADLASGIEFHIQANEAMVPNSKSINISHS